MISRFGVLQPEDEFDEPAGTDFAPSWRNTSLRKDRLEQGTRSTSINKFLYSYDKSVITQQGA